MLILRRLPAYTLLFVAAFVVRVAVLMCFVGLHSPPDQAAGGLDVVDYEELAYNLSQGRGYTVDEARQTARRAPGTSFIVSLPYVFFGRSYAAAHLWLCFLSALTCVLTAYIGATTFGLRCGAIAGALTALYPGCFYYSAHFFSEGPFTFFTMSALALTFAKRANLRPLLDIMAGFFWGAAILTRPQLLMALPSAAVVGMCTYSSSVILRVLLQSLPALSLICCWQLRNYLVLGHFTLCTVVGGVTLFGANNDFVADSPRLRGGWYFGPEVTEPVGWRTDVDEFELGKAGMRYGVEFIRRRPLTFLATSVDKFARLLVWFPDTPNLAVRWAFGLAWCAVGPFVLRGLIIGRRRSKSTWTILLIVLSSIAVTTALFYGDVRFRDPVAPVLLLLAAVGMDDFLRRLEQRRISRDCAHC